MQTRRKARTCGHCQRKERCHAKFLEGHLNELGLLIGPNKSGSYVAKQPDFFGPIRRPPEILHDIPLS